MAITSEDIHNQSFAIDRKGYDVDEVDVFLEHVADEIDYLNDRIAELEEELEEARAAKPEETIVVQEEVEPEGITGEIMAGPSSEALAEKDARIADLEAQLAEKSANDSAISQALIIAQRSADEIIVKANAQASETMQDAREEADRIINRANADRQDVLDAIRKLEDDREDTREEYADILRDFIDDATRKLNDLGYDDDIDNIPGIGRDAGEIDVVYEEDVATEYTTPAATATAVVETATPVASVYEKDLSGFGDVEDDFEDVD
ncbi:MAG: DivIVA domain-containing protein [Eggerthellaceae bacterium]|nr:DivIVA domain-containing protein [Eggerthellaceae bacterium]